MLDRVYGHHHPDYLLSASRLIGYRRRETVPVSVSVPVTLPSPGPGTQAIAIISGPGRTRTSNQTVMSGPVSPESSIKIDVFRGVRARSFASVHGISVVHLWSVHHSPKAADKRLRALAEPVRALLDPQRRGHNFMAARLVQLAGTRAGGFVLTCQEAAGKWGKATYSLARTAKAAQSTGA